MDMPIYLQFLDSEYNAATPPNPLPRYRWYVIEEKGDQETAEDDELGEDLWIHKSKKDRVRDLRLPHLNYEISDAAFAVSNSRIFFVGGETSRKSEGIYEANGIVSIDLKRSDLSWQRSVKWAEELRDVDGAAVYPAEGTINVYIGSQAGDVLMAFKCDDVERGRILPLSKPKQCWPAFLLASSCDEILLYKPGMSSDGSADDWDLSELLFFSVLTGSMTRRLCLPDPPCQGWTHDPSPFYRTVVMREFLIYFSDCCPMKGTQDFCPALYVYDMHGRKWLSQPVQGLPNNGDILPSLDADRKPLHYASLMRVRRDILKWALVWTIRVKEDEDGGINDQTEVHWVKFILHSQEVGDTTFHAEILSSGTCYGGNTFLINCTAG